MAADPQPDMQGQGADAWGSPTWQANQSNATKGTGQNWRLGGYGNWGGVPYMQGTTHGQALSPYANLVDQIYAAQQPITLGQQFNRWNFGGPAWQGGAGLIGGTPTGLLGGTVPPPVQPTPVATPVTPSPAFDQSMSSFKPAPTPTTGGFQNPSTPMQQNFNSLLGQNPDAAYQYAFSGPDYQQMQGLLGDKYSSMVNKYNPGGSGYWMSAAGGNQYTVQTPTGPKTYTLPTAAGPNQGNYALALQIMQQAAAKRGNPA